LSLILFAGRSADVAMASFEESAQRSAARAITLGTARWYLRLAPAVEKLLTRPQGVADEIWALLVASAHQVEYSRNAPQATVHAAVDAARVLKSPGATGFVNAVLRRFVAERADLLAQVDKGLPGRSAHPAWLVEAIQASWPDRYEAILSANNEHPPMVLRVDLSRRTLAAYLVELHGAGIAAHSSSWSASAVRLDRPVAVSALPGFEEGIVSVQDSGAQLAPRLLEAGPGMRVLDACAAPGGKTGHILEHFPDLASLVAVDIAAHRVVRIRENLERLRRSARVIVADVRAPQDFWDGQPFDRILVDAPCSSTGVIRRHPDIKLLRRHDDIAAFATQQFEILAAAFALLAPGGRLVYSTCSVLAAENEQVVERFLAQEPAAIPGKMPSAAELAPGAVARGPGLQLLPGADAGADGFYYACLEKTTAGT
jgi:16S rRNA (cytosine967-C5)-methyltransferase